MHLCLRKWFRIFAIVNKNTLECVSENWIRAFTSKFFTELSDVDSFQYWFYFHGLVLFLVLSQGFCFILLFLFMCSRAFWLASSFRQRHTCWLEVRFFFLYLPFFFLPFSPLEALFLSFSAIHYCWLNISNITTTRNVCGEDFWIFFSF